MHIEQDESADDVSSIPATSTPARSGAKITTTYGGRARRAMTEDALFSPRAGDTRGDDETRSRSSPVLSSTPMLFPKMPAKPTPRKSQPKTVRPKESEQLILDLGQKIRIKCAGCEMQYDTSCAEDCALHAKYHERTVKGIDWSSKALSLHGEAVAEIDIRPSPSVLRAKPNNFGSGKAGESKTATILRYDMGSMKDAVANRKITELLTAVDEALGAAAVEAAVIKTCKVFVAVCGGRAVGAALVGRIASGTARQVISRSGEDKENHNETGMLWDDAGDAIFVSEALSDAQTPPVGIYRIHTIPGFRRSGIASELLDAAANHSIYGLTLNKLIGTYGSRAKAVAFSQPTEAGRKLAEAWIRKGVSQDESPRLIVFEA